MGFLGWVGKGFRPELGNMVMMALGGILLTQNLVDDKSFGDLWPALAVAVGIAIIFGSGRNKRRKKKFENEVQEAREALQLGRLGQS
jgi:hypothetical protein